MRFALLIVAAVTGIALAGEPTLAELFKTVRDPSIKPIARHGAARLLAARVGADATARTLAMTIVITDDAAIREPVITALIAAGTLTPAAAARVPTRHAVDLQLHALVARAQDDRAPSTDDRRPTADACRITAADDRGVTLDCLRDTCGPACAHEQRTVTLFTSGSRWKLVDQQIKSTDDGACGDCDFAE